MDFRVSAGTKVAEFLQSTAIVNVLEGPIGSGKTDALLIKCMMTAQLQARSPIDGLRRSRFAVIRNSSPDLKRSTIKSWRERYPVETFGPVKIGSPMHHNISYPFDGSQVRMEVDFIGLDDDDDIRKLRSTQYTRIMFDELEFIIKSLFDEARQRLRYPAEEHGGPTHPGVDATTNAPPEDHWLPIMTGRVPVPPGLSPEDEAALRWPPMWKWFKQPPAVLEVRDQHGAVVDYAVNIGQGFDAEGKRIPPAENLKNLPKRYYEDMIPGMHKSAIDARLRVEVVLVTSGSPVWPMFRREFHVAKQVLDPVPGHDVLVWLDFGRVYPAALFAQEVNQRIYVQHEILGFNEPASVFAPRVKRFLEKTYPDYAFRCVGDPKGRDRGQQTEQSSYDVFRAHGMPVSAAAVKQNDIEMRTEAVAYALNDNPAGIPRMVISPMCRTLIVGMAGRYCLVREENGELTPKKDKYSNLCDALQYGCISLGEGRRMVNLRPIGDVRAVQTRVRRSLRRVG